MEICHLEDAPNLAAMIADRCWHAWWTDSDVTLKAYQRAIEGMGVRGRLPCAFVAHQHGHYVGSALLIQDDLPARPALAPWIAALWVDPSFRKLGIASKLIKAARNEASQLGYALCYLNATDTNSPYYEERGFQRIESNVGRVNIFSIPSAGGNETSNRQ